MKKLFRRLAMPFALLLAFATVAPAAPTSPNPAVGLYWAISGDPTIGAGVCAPLWQLLFRVDTNVLYYKSGAACTAWTPFGGGGGGGTVTGTGTPNTVTKWITSTEIGNANPTDNGASFAISEQFALSSSISPPAFTGSTVNDYNPTGLATTYVIDQAVTSPTVITGIEAQPSGTQIDFRNTTSSTSNLTFDNATGSLAANQFVLPGAVNWILQPGNSLLFRYNGSNWRLIAAVTNDVPVFTVDGLLTTNGGITNASSTTILNTFGRTTTGSIFETMDTLTSPIAAGTLNDWNPTFADGANGAFVTYFRAPFTNVTTITGFTASAFASGRELYFYNSGTTAATFTNQGAGSTAGNRFIMPSGTSVQLDPGAVMHMAYDTVLSRWVVDYVSTTAGASGTSGSMTLWSDSNTLGSYAGSTSSTCTAGQFITEVASSAAGALTTTCAAGGGGTVGGTGTSPDIAVWTSSSAITSYGGSTPSACSAGQFVTQPALSASGGLTTTCSEAVTSGTLTSTDLTVATGVGAIGNYGGSTASTCSAGQFVTAGALSAAGALTTTCAAPASGNASSSTIYGPGTDGAATFDGVTSPVAGATLSGSTYTMTRPIFCSGCTVNNGVSIKEAGYPFFDNGTLTLSGTANINDDGNAASTTTGGAARSATWYGANVGGPNGGTNNGGASADLLCSPFNASAAGGTAGAATGATGGNGNACTGGGGGGAAVTNAGGTGGASTVAGVANCGNIYLTLQQGRLAPNLGTGPVTFGTSGGGGGTDVTPGGGGGAGGGIAFVASYKLAGSGTVSAKGGAGGSVATAGAGGGGGGAGGIVVMTYNTNTGSVSAVVTGGAPGTGGTGGGTGGTGGSCINFKSCSTCSGWNLSGDGT